MRWINVENRKGDAEGEKTGAGKEIGNKNNKNNKNHAD